MGPLVLPPGVPGLKARQKAIRLVKSHQPPTVICDVCNKSFDGTKAADGFDLGRSRFSAVGVARQSAIAESAIKSAQGATVATSVAKSFRVNGYLTVKM